MSELSAKLSIALNELPFVQVVEHDQQGQSINALCRVKNGAEGEWSALAERVLREAARREGRPDYWHTHIARLYMLREGNFVFGWVFIIQAPDASKAVPVIVELIQQISNVITGSTPVAIPQGGHPYRQTSIPDPPPSARDDDYDPPEPVEEDEDYSEPDSPLPKGAVPEADAQGNPIVPREHRVKKVLMAGLPKNYDRNAPDPEKRKGSWQIESRKGKGFRPPVKR